MKLATKTGDFNAYTNSQIDSLKLLRKAGFKYWLQGVFYL